jgi:hypothetical protein
VKDGAVNGYSLIVKNRSLDPEAFRLSIAGIQGAELLISQYPLILPPYTVLRTKVYVVVKRKNLTERVTQLRFILENIVSREIKVEEESTFVYPEQSEKGWEI